MLRWSSWSLSFGLLLTGALGALAQDPPPEKGVEPAARKVVEAYLAAIAEVRDTTYLLDKTELLLIGQERADVAVVQQSGMITVAARFDSGLDLTRMLGVKGGMPTRVSAPEDRLQTLLDAINGPAGS